MRKFFISLFFLALFFVPILADIYNYRQLFIFCGFKLVPKELFQEIPTLSPSNFIGIFEIVELIILFCYLTLVRSNIIKLIFIMYTVVFSVFGIVISSLANFLNMSLLHEQIFLNSIEKLCILAANSYLLALFFACLGNLILRNLSYRQILMFTLIVSASIGIIYTRFNVIEDPRCLQLGFLQYRFSLSEIFYFAGIQLATLSYISIFISKFFDTLFNKHIQLLDKELRVSDYYYKHVQMGKIAIVSPMWEKQLLGCRWDVKRIGRKYYGVPNPNTIKKKIWYFLYCQKVCKTLPQFFLFLFSILMFFHY